MKKSIPLFIVLFFLGSVFAFGENERLHDHSIEGVVRDQANGLPLVGATVLLEPVNWGCVTGANGEYAFGILPSGEYTLLVKFLGYQTDTLKVTVEAGIELSLESNLMTSDIQLSQTEIIAGRENDNALISSLDTRLRPVLSSQEVLRQVPGLFIAQHAGGGKAEQIFLRGYDIDHGTDIAISTDGVPANMVSHAHGQGYTDLHYLIPELIEGISFGKGPYDADKGNFATAGYVDFRTARDIFGSSLKTELGSFGTVRNVLLMDLLPAIRERKNQGAYLAVEQLFSNGYFVQPQNLNRINVMGKYHMTLGQHHELQASLSQFSSSWSASSQMPSRVVEAGVVDAFGTIDQREGGQTMRSGLNLEMKSFGRRDGLWRNQIYLHRYDFDLFSNFTFFLKDTLHGDLIRQRESRWVAGYQGSYTKAAQLMGRQLTLRSGAGVRVDLPRDISLASVGDGSPSYTQRGNVREVNSSGHLQADWQATSRLTVGGAVRADHFSFLYQDLLQEQMHRKDAVQQAILSPKAQVSYTPSERIKLYAKAGSGFHSNDTRVVVDSAASLALPRVIGMDLGTFWKPAPGILFNIAAWTLHSQSEFVYVGDEGIVEQSGRAVRSGVDLSVRWQVRKWLFADADLNLTRPRLLDLPQGENYIPLAPVLSSTGGLTFVPGKVLRGTLRYRYLAHRPANEDYSLTAEGYCLLDASLSVALRRIDLGITASNLLNTQWKESQFETTSRLRNETLPVTEVNFTPGAPLALRGSVTVHFD